MLPFCLLVCLSHLNRHPLCLLLIIKHLSIMQSTITGEYLNSRGCKLSPRTSSLKSNISLSGDQTLTYDGIQVTHLTQLDFQFKYFIGYIDVISQGQRDGLCVKRPLCTHEDLSLVPSQTCKNHAQAHTTVFVLEDGDTGIKDTF